MNLNEIEIKVLSFLSKIDISPEWISAVIPYIRLAFAGNDYYITDILNFNIVVNKQFKCINKLVIDTEIYFPNSKETQYGYIEYIFTSHVNEDINTLHEIGHKVTHYAINDDFEVNVLSIGIPYTTKKWYSHY